MAHKSDHFSAFHCKADVFEHSLIRFIAKVDIAVFDPSPELRFLRLFRIPYLRFVVQNIKHARRSGDSVRNGARKRNHIIDRAVYHRRVCRKLHKRSRVHSTAQDIHSPGKHQRKMAERR